MISARVAVVKCRPLSNQCVVIVLGSLGLWSVCCLHLKKEFRSCDSGRQWDILLPLMNSFNKTEAAFFLIG